MRTEGWPSWLTDTKVFVTIAESSSIRDQTFPFCISRTARAEPIFNPNNIGQNILIERPRFASMNTRVLLFNGPEHRLFIFYIMRIDLMTEWLTKIILQ